MTSVFCIGYIELGLIVIVLLPLRKLGFFQKTYDSLGRKYRTGIRFPSPA